MFQRFLLDDSDIEPLGEGVFDVLEKVGLICQNAELRRALAAAGAKVDEAAERATFPRAMQRAFVEQVRRESAEAPAPGERPFPSLGLPGIGLQVAQFFYDDEKRERRPGNREDFITLVKLGEALHGEGGVGHALTLTDVPPMIEPLEAALLLAEYATRPQVCFAWRVDQTDALIEMGAVLGLENWYSHGAVCFAHPLRFDRDSADKFARRIRTAKSAGLTAMPIVGVSAPVTLAGFLAVTVAEHLALWITARAMKPDVQLSGGIWVGSMDMRTGEISYSAPDAMLYGFATAEFIRRWVGLETPVGGGEYCSARTPGLYAALEKAHKAMTIAAFTGRHPGIGDGMVDNGKTISPVQLLLDREFTEAARQFARRVEVTPEALAVDTALEVGFGIERGYLEAEHTLRHFRECLWTPAFVDRSGCDGFAHEEDVLAKVRGRVRELLAGYQKPERDPDKLARLRAIVERARKRLAH